VFFKLIRVHLLVCEFYIYQNARCNNKKVEIYFAQIYIYIFNLFGFVENLPGKYIRILGA